MVGGEEAEEFPTISDGILKIMDCNKKRNIITQIEKNLSLFVDLTLDEVGSIPI
jgi:hypothetical protein